MTRTRLTSIYFLVLGSLLIYSYALVDPNITFINHPLWTSFRNIMVQLGYHNRPISTLIFVVISAALTFLHVKLVKDYDESPVKLAVITAGILLFSYPFLSRDFFNYMFDARILTVHHANPYFHAALDFPSDQWLRFMHWTHRPYPYGPTFLPLTLIPSFLAGGKFILSFLFFKLMYAAVYIWSVYMLTKIKRSYGLFFATSPLIIFEGLVNNHNDLIAVMFALMGIYYASNKLISFLSFVSSAGIKFVTTPALLLVSKTQDKKRLAYIVGAFMGALILYVSLTGEIQQWYFLNFLILIPFLYSHIKSTYILAFGLLISYYPFILYGDWNEEKLLIKHMVIIIAFLANMVILVFNKNEA